jgi:hypothetical protein
MIIKCNKCHHEWQAVSDSDNKCSWCKGKGKKIGSDYLDKEEENKKVICDFSLSQGCTEAECEHRQFHSVRKEIQDTIVPYNHDRGILYSTCDNYIKCYMGRTVRCIYIKERETI